MATTRTAYELKDGRTLEIAITVPDPVPPPPPPPVVPPSVGPIDPRTTMRIWPKQGAIAAAVKYVADMKVLGAQDFGNGQLNIPKDKNLTVYGGAKNLYVKAEQWGNASMVLTGTDSSIENITFMDNTGDCIKINGTRCKIRNMVATTFSGYAVFAEGAVNLDIDGMYVNGFSADQSILRLEGNSTGSIRNFILIDTANTKATIRGSFDGELINGYVEGAIFGLNPLENDDAGQLMCLGKWAAPVPGGSISAANLPQCLKVAADAIKANPKITALEVCKLTYAVAVDAKGQPLQGGNMQGSVDARKRGLDQHSNVRITNLWVVNAPVRWAAGTKWYWKGGRIISNTLFDNPGVAYPTSEDRYIPGDIRRPFPDITFEEVEFTTSKTIAEVKALGVKYGAKFINCTVNGVKF